VSVRLVPIGIGVDVKAMDHRVLQSLSTAAGDIRIPAKLRHPGQGHIVTRLDRRYGCSANIDAMVGP
jgi:hypothetical protein